MEEALFLEQLLQNKIKLVRCTAPQYDQPASSSGSQERLWEAKTLQGLLQGFFPVRKNIDKEYMMITSLYV